MKIKKISIIIGCAITGIVIYILFSFYCLFSHYGPEYTYYTITSPSNNDTLFVKVKSWGITKDQRSVFITAQLKKDDNYDPHYDYIFRGLQGLLYKVGNDTVYIYAETLSLIPDSFHSQLVVVQVEIFSNKMEEFQKNSFKKGMTRISNY